MHAARTLSGLLLAAVVTFAGCAGTGQEERLPSALEVYIDDVAQLRDDLRAGSQALDAVTADPRGLVARLRAEVPALTQRLDALSAEIERIGRTEDVDAVPAMMNRRNELAEEIGAWTMRAQSRS